VARQFAHLHNARTWHLQARAKPLAQGARTLATRDEPGRAELADALEDSAGRIEDPFRQALAGVPRVRVVKRGAVLYLACLVAHEAHHRGNILLTLEPCGQAVPQAERFAIWDRERV
jgi:uncharacterized damage-inducible protein DinB